jgi:hypothetical protein
VAQPHATWQVLVMRTSWTSGTNQATLELVRQQTTSLGGFGKGTDFSTFFLRVWCLPLLYLGSSTSTFLDESWCALFLIKIPKALLVRSLGHCQSSERRFSELNRRVEQGRLWKDVGSSVETRVMISADKLGGGMFCKDFTVCICN